MHKKTVSTKSSWKKKRIENIQIGKRLKFNLPRRLHSCLLRLSFRRRPCLQNQEFVPPSSPACCCLARRNAASIPVIGNTANGSCTIFLTYTWKHRLRKPEVWWVRTIKSPPAPQYFTKCPLISNHSCGLSCVFDVLPKTSKERLKPRSRLENSRIISLRFQTWSLQHCKQLSILSG